MPEIPSSPFLWFWVEKIGFITVQQCVTKSKSFTGVPKSSPWGPQMGQVFCPTRQKTLAPKNVGSQVRQGSTSYLVRQKIYGINLRFPRDSLIMGPRLSDPVWVCYRSTSVKMKSLLCDNTDPLLVIWGECGGGALNLRYWKCLSLSGLNTKNSCSEISRILILTVLDRQNWSVSAETADVPFKEKERIDISAHNISCLCPQLSAEKLLSPKGQQDVKTASFLGWPSWFFFN